MATITGTSGADAILRHSLSDGVVTDSLVSGTDNGDFNTIRGYGGNDLIEASDAGADVFGGSGNDRIFGGLGYDNLYGDGGSDAIIAGDNFGTFLWDIVDGGLGADRMSGGSGLHSSTTTGIRFSILAPAKATTRRTQSSPTWASTPSAKTAGSTGCTSTRASW